MKKITIAGLLVFQTVFVFLPLLVVSIKQHAFVGELSAYLHFTPTKACYENGNTNKG
jgi:hypothetical protein